MASPENILAAVEHDAEQRAREIAARYRYEFVDLSESHIDGNLFRDSGALMPQWQTRILVTTNETCGALEELLQHDTDEPSSANSYSSRF